jgi:hypothetical protein
MAREVSMLRPHLLAAPLLLILASCGSPPPAEAPTTTPTASPQASADPAPSAAPVASGDQAPTAAPAASAAPAAAPEAPASEAATLARDLAKSGGRRIGYSASKKAFVYPVEHRVQNGFSLDIQFTGEDGNPRDAMRICQPGECEDKLDEMLKAFLPKLTERLESEGYTTIRAIGWPGGGDELEIQSLGAKLHYTKGKLTRTLQGKPAAAPLTKVGGSRFDSAPEAVFVVPGNKLLAVFAKPSGDAKGLVQELHVFKLP